MARSAPSTGRPIGLHTKAVHALTLHMSASQASAQLNTVMAHMQPRGMLSRMRSAQRKQASDAKAVRAHGMGGHSGAPARPAGKQRDEKEQNVLSESRT